MSNMEGIAVPSAGAGNASASFIGKTSGVGSSPTPGGGLGFTVMPSLASSLISHESSTLAKTSLN